MRPVDRDPGGAALAFGNDGIGFSHHTTFK
jgi:hypothetical protein